MNKLTEDEIQSYMKGAKPDQGIDAIDRKTLEKIDKDNLPVLERKRITGHDWLVSGMYLVDDNGKPVYQYDNFTPKARSIYLKPAFAGRQFPLGIVDGKIIFPNGRWFAL